jgi:hypothetical protein
MFFSSHKDRQQDILFSRAGNIFLFLIRSFIKQKQERERERENDRYKKERINRTFS